MSKKPDKSKRRVAVAQQNKKLQEKIHEAFSSVIPITVIVFILSIFFETVSVGSIMMFLMGSVLLIVGMGLFSLGADTAMIPMGEGIGAQFTKTKKLWLVILIILFMGILITVAEPDLQVLASQVGSIPEYILIGTVAVGVGILLVLAVLRILLQVDISKMLIVLYVIVFAVAVFAPKDFIPVAFDSGGVTTGPITVPFIMALGLGLASVRGDKSSQEDSFGFVGLCSVGPILAVLLLSIVYKPESSADTAVHIPDVANMKNIAQEFIHEILPCLREVTLALSPIIAFFILFQIFTRRYKKIELLKIGVGFIYTLLGLVLFLTGVIVGFIPVGHLIGSEIAGSVYKWLLVPIGMLMGYFVVAAEPAVHVLTKQVEQISGGAIPPAVLQRCLSIGVSASLGLSMIRVLTGISIFWFLVPGYAIALAITFKVPKIFTGIAFDSGGVASGPMTSTFLLPFTIGASFAAGGNIMLDAFGMVALVAMTPLIAIQILGVVYGKNMKKSTEIEVAEAKIETPVNDEEIVDYGNDGKK